MGFVGCDDRVGVVGGVFVDVSDRLVDVGDDGDRHAQTQIFFIPILFVRGCHRKSGGERAGFAIAPNFDSGLHQLVHDARDVVGCDTFVHQ